MVNAEEFIGNTISDATDEVSYKPMSNVFTTTFFEIFQNFRHNGHSVKGFGQNRMNKWNKILSSYNRCKTSIQGIQPPAFRVKQS
jgi:hypothetical protein